MCKVGHKEKVLCKKCFITDIKDIIPSIWSARVGGRKKINLPGDNVQAIIFIITGKGQTLIS